MMAHTGRYQGAIFTVEPRVNELVSFFLASVSDLSRQQGLTPKDKRELSPTTSCADATFAQPVALLSLDPDADSTLFFGEGMEGMEDDCISRSTSTPSSPRSVSNISVSSPAAPLSPVFRGDASGTSMLGARVPSFEARTHTTSRSLYCGLQVEVGSPDDLSSKTTPTADWMCDPMCEDLGLIGSPGSIKVGARAHTLTIYTHITHTHTHKHTHTWRSLWRTAWRFVRWRAPSTASAPCVK
jgi:hypothetical protein